MTPADLKAEQGDGPSSDKNCCCFCQLTGCVSAKGRHTVHVVVLHIKKPVVLANHGLLQTATSVFGKRLPHEAPLMVILAPVVPKRKQNNRLFSYKCTTGNTSLACCITRVPRRFTPHPSSLGHSLGPDAAYAPITGVHYLSRAVSHRPLGPSFWGISARATRCNARRPVSRGG